MLTKVSLISIILSLVIPPVFNFFSADALAYRTSINLIDNKFRVVI